MAFSRIQIISMVVGLLGKYGINTIGTDPLSNQASLILDLVLPASMQKMSSRFGTTIVQLSLSNQTPSGTQWRYMYPLPGDYLKLITLDPGGLDFEIYENGFIYTNYGPTSPLYLEYVRAVMPEALSAVFVDYLTMAVAARLAIGSTHNAQMAPFMKDWADTLKAEASAIDAQNRPQTAMQSSSVIQWRMVGGCWPNSYSITGD